MLSGALGISSLGQWTLGAPVAVAGVAPPLSVNPAPFDRTFFVPQLGLPWQGSKEPEDILNFSFNWHRELNCDSIASSLWSLESSELSIAGQAVDATNSIATAALSGGVAQNIYNVTNTIITASGQTLNATFRLFVNAYNW